MLKKERYMVSIILFVTACIVLVVAGILLAKSHKKEEKVDITENKEQNFNICNSPVTFIRRVLSGDTRSCKYSEADAGY